MKRRSIEDSFGEGVQSLAVLLVGAALGSKRGATSLALDILPFLIGNAIKMVLAALALPTAWKLAQ